MNGIILVFYLASGPFLVANRQWGEYLYATTHVLTYIDDIVVNEEKYVFLGLNFTKISAKDSPDVFIT